MSSHKATNAIAMQLVLNKPPLFFSFHSLFKLQIPRMELDPGPWGDLSGSQAVPREVRPCSLNLP